MRFKASKTFDKTCVNLLKVKKTLRYHHSRMLPVILKNLKNSEYLTIEEKSDHQKQNLEDYKSLKQYIKAKRLKDQKEFIQEHSMKQQYLNLDNEKRPEFSLFAKKHEMPHVDWLDISHNPKTTMELSRRIHSDLTN